MKFSAVSALIAGGFVAAAPVSETITVSDFIYRAPAGGFTVDGQHVDRYMRFQLSADDIICQALDADIPAAGYTCDDPAYSFDTLNPGVLDATFLIRLYHRTEKYEDVFFLSFFSSLVLTCHIHIAIMWC